MQTKLVLKQPSALKLRFTAGARGPAGTIEVGTVTTGAPGSSVQITNSGTSQEAVLNFTIPRGDVGATGAAGSNGTDGDDGWSPIFAVVTDGARRVLQVSDWTGGTGTEPASGLYVGPTGLVAAIGDAVDIRGTQGPAGTIADGDKGDITVSDTGNTLTIDADVVGNTKLANMATATFKGRTTAGTGDPEDLTATQATALLNPVVGDSGSGGTKGLVPAPAAGDAAAGEFLKASGAWANPFALNIRDYGAVGDGSADDTTAYNNFIAAVTASTQKQGYMPSGTYKLTSQPSDIAAPIVIFGDGMGVTTLQRAYNGTPNKGVLALVPGSNGCIFRDFTIRSSTSTSGGALISIVATSGGNPPSFISFENLYLTTSATDTHVNTVYIDGTPRTTAPIGCRDIFFKNCHIFGANGYSIVANGAIGLSVIGGGVYAAGGSNAASGAIQITGNGTTVNSQYVVFDIVACNGLSLTNCSDMQIRSASIGAVSGTSINNAGTCTWTAVYGHPSGTVLGNWANSGIYRPTGFATT